MGHSPLHWLWTQMLGANLHHAVRDVDFAPVEHGYLSYSDKPLHSHAGCVATRGAFALIPSILSKDGRRGSRPEPWRKHQCRAKAACSHSKRHSCFALAASEVPARADYRNQKTRSCPFVARRRVWLRGAD